MDCKRVLLLLPAYYDKQLEASDKEELEAHIGQCNDCSKELAQIEKLAGELKTVSKTALPLGMASDLLFFTRKSGIRYHISSLKRSFIARRRTYRHYLIEFSYAVALLIVVVGFVKAYSSFTGDRAPSEPKKPSQSIELMQRPLNTKAKNSEPGVESLRTQQGNTIPEITISNKDYDRQTIGEAMANPTILKYCGQFTIAQVADLQNGLTARASEEARYQGEDGAVAERCVRTALSILDKPALPVYVEKARFENKQVWLITLIWNTGEPTAHLSKVSIFAIDAVKNRVVYTE